MKTAKVLINLDFLAKLLFPPDTYIRRVQHPTECMLGGEIEVIVEHPSLEEVNEGEKIPLIQVIHERIEKRFGNYA